MTSGEALIILNLSHIKGLQQGPWLGTGCWSTQWVGASGRAGDGKGSLSTASFKMLPAMLPASPA